MTDGVLDCVPFLVPKKNRAGSFRKFLSVFKIALGKGQGTILSFCRQVGSTGCGQGRGDVRETGNWIILAWVMMGNKGISLLLRNRNFLCLCSSWRNQVIYFQSSPISYSNRAEVGPLFILAWQGGGLLGLLDPLAFFHSANFSSVLQALFQNCAYPKSLLAGHINYRFSSWAGTWVFFSTRKHVEPMWEACGTVFHLNDRWCLISCCIITCTSRREGCHSLTQHTHTHSPMFRSEVKEGGRNPDLLWNLRAPLPGTKTGEQRFADLQPCLCPCISFGALQNIFSWGLAPKTLILWAFGMA